MTVRKAAVLVAGSWGTALASVLADNGCQVAIWTRSEAQAREINSDHRNRRYLPDAALPPSIRGTSSMEEALEGADAVVLAAPSAAMRDVARLAAPLLPAGAQLIHAAKGFELDSLKRISRVIVEEIPSAAGRIVVLSGPSHAEEVIRRNPTTIVVASESAEAAEAAQNLFNNAYFRVYTNSDVTGVEVGGALKNIIALGAGLSDGLGFGDNAKAALITRGLAEIARLGVKLGANPLTFLGLAGVGDLVVTCTSRHSRNWRAGSMLAQGLSAEQVQEKMGMVVEGIRTTQAAFKIAGQLGVEMPITSELHHVLFEGKSPKSAVEALMNRDPTHETDGIARASMREWFD